MTKDKHDTYMSRLANCNTACCLCLCMQAACTAQCSALRRKMHEKQAMQYVLQQEVVGKQGEKF